MHVILANAFIQSDLQSYTVDKATGSNSGLSVLLKDTSTRAGIESPTPWLKDGPANHWPTVAPIRNKLAIMINMLYFEKVR